MGKVAKIRGFREKSLDLIEKINAVVDEYKKLGFRLSVRQAYYQLVAKNVIGNNTKSYKNLVNLSTAARKAGLIDADALEDRARPIRNLCPDFHRTCDVNLLKVFRREIELSFITSRWANQPKYVECWVEKEALSEIVGSVAKNMDVAYLACKGYPSHSALNEAAKRFQERASTGQDCMVLYLGDFDPSGVDMLRSSREKLAELGAGVKMERIALNPDQIQQYKLPPNIAKESDPRFEGYQIRYGSESWELDALPPDVLSDIIRREIGARFDEDIEARNIEERDKHVQEQYERFGDILDLLSRHVS